MKVVFIACSSKKLAKSAPAKDLYISPLFKLSLQYAHKLKPHKIYILSAKYGLTNLNTIIKPYNITLNHMSAKEIKVWAGFVKKQMKNQNIDFEKGTAIFLAGKNYRKYILPLFAKIQVPLKGLGIGKQLKYLKNHV